MHRNINKVDDDLKAQIAQLRRMMSPLTTNKSLSALNEAKLQIERRAQQRSDYARGQAEAASRKVREKPLIAILVALAAGYLISRLLPE